MENFIQQSQHEITITSTSVTLGYAVGNTEVPRVLVLWPAATATVTLPPIPTTIPTGTTNPVSLANYNPGAQSLIITIKSLTGQVVNLSAASGDVFYTGDTIVISSSGARASLVSSLSDRTWYLI